MHHYSRDDFISYYGGSFLLSPSTNKVVRVLQGDPARESHVILTDKSSVHLRDLDWKHVKTPQLGFRTLENGRLLYYVQRRAVRERQKGVTPVAIVIDIPGIMTSIAQELGYSQDVARLAQLNDKLAEAIFHPEFVSMEDALELLASKRHAVAFALSPDWAITLGLHSDKRYLLHYKNRRAGHSVDGKKWAFNDSDVEYIFNRSKL